MMELKISATDLKKAALAELAEMLKVPPATLDLSKTIEADLGLDSLDIADLCSGIEHKLDYSFSDKVCYTFLQRAPNEAPKTAEDFLSALEADRAEFYKKH